jgi:hypothetical protein
METPRPTRDVMAHNTRSALLTTIEKLRPHLLDWFEISEIRGGGYEITPLCFEPTLDELPVKEILVVASAREANALAVTILVDTPEGEMTCVPDFLSGLPGFVAARQDASPAVPWNVEGVKAVCITLLHLLSVLVSARRPDYGVIC